MYAEHVMREEAGHPDPCGHRDLSQCQNSCFSDPPTYVCVWVFPSDIHQVNISPFRDWHTDIEARGADTSDALDFYCECL